MISDIAGLRITPLQLISHPKGDLLHIIRNDESSFFTIGEVYCSTIHQGQIKGWKKHLHHYVNLVVLHGAIVFYLIDDRGHDAPIMRKFIINPLINHCRLAVPPHVWVAFKGLQSSNILVNCMPQLHDPSEQINIPLSSFPIDVYESP